MKGGSGSAKTCCFSFALNRGMIEQMNSAGIYGPEKQASASASQAELQASSSEDEITFD